MSDPSATLKNVVRAAVPRSVRNWLPASDAKSRVAYNFLIAELYGVLIVDASKHY